MTMNKIEWKKIRDCDMCNQVGFVRDLVDKEGKIMMEVCFYECGDIRNIPTPDNSACDFCRENKGVEEFHTKEGKWDGYFCERCVIEINSIIQETEEDEREAEKREERYISEVDNQETIELFIDIPEIYSSHAKYTKNKEEFENRKSTLEEGSYLIIKD